MPWGVHKGKSIDELPSSYLKLLTEECDDDGIFDEADEEYRWRSYSNAHTDNIFELKQRYLDYRI